MSSSSTELKMPLKTFSELDWHPDEVNYLQDMSKLCQELSQKFNRYHDMFKRKQMYFRIPNIFISSITGLVSLTSNSWPQYHGIIAIVVGGSSILVALLTSIETYLQINDIISGSAQASSNFQKLSEHIQMEFALPMRLRCQGIVFLKDCHAAYEKNWEIAPNILKRIRFVKSLYHGLGNPTLTLAASNDLPRSSPTVDNVSIEMTPSSPKVAPWTTASTKRAPDDLNHELQVYLERTQSIRGV